MKQHFMEGNEAIAWGAMIAGCRFFAGYPITPATTIFNAMLKHLPPAGGVCLQGEDEIASIGFCLGAAMAGAKAMTATSGPGISLYSEQISFAIGSEIPIVIVDVQRLGPSTGSATRGADGDVQFLRWGSSGGLPVIVLAPVDVADCVTLTVHAFNLAERFRCPVFIAANKEISMTRESVDLDRLSIPAVVDRKTATQEVPYFPFAVSGEGRVPDFLPIGARQLVRQTSSTHGEDGYITVDPEAIQRFQDRLNDKITAAAEELALYDEVADPDADTLLITYGITGRAAKAGISELRAEGRSAALLVLKTLWPVPEALIRQKAAGVKRVLVAEMNLGQYVREIRRILCDRRIDFIGGMNGNLITPKRIKEAICHE
jgi:2-oxoglutarate ferredoxin oxidoreductase subunit alpha